MSPIKRLLRSQLFFWLTLVVFAAETIWLAVVNNFPMAFDEGYHFGLIQFFSKHLNPFLSSQPVESYQFGAIVHNPSFLYHYLFSFPYMVVSYFTDDIRIQVISLRLINVGFAVASLYLIHKALQRFGIHRALASAIVLLFAFTPIFSVLSAQLNYDNLLILCTAGTIYLVAKIWERIHERGTVKASTLLGLISLCAYGSLVKFAYAPVAVGVALLLVYLLIRHWKQRVALWQSVQGSFVSLSLIKRVALVTLTVSGLAMFAGYYGYNTVKYHIPVPQCHQVLGVEPCKNYYAWNRNYTLAQQPKSAERMSVISYSIFWLKVSYYQLFAAIIPTGGLVYIAKTFYLAVSALIAFAVLAVIIKLLFIYRHYKPLCVMTVVIVSYLLVLWGRNYNDYIQLGEPVAIQGRYLLPVLAYLYAFLVLGVWHLLNTERIIIHAFRTMLAATTIFIFLYFGGFVRYASEVTPGFKWQKPKPVFGTLVTDKTVEF